MQEPNCNKDKPEKEAIHSGHFMVSHFEAEEQDDEDDVAVPVPETEVKNSLENLPAEYSFQMTRSNPDYGKTNQQLSIETSLSKLFQCMSLAYRQKLTSPKWNRFRGIKLRWKDKIRLNNVIWRCWHMQFIMKQNTLICQFASPLDVDTHNKPEAVVLEGKYWKRKLQAVTAEYKKWRMYYRNQSLGGNSKDDYGKLMDRELSWNSQSNDGLHMLIDEDYMDFMSDTLFSTISNQPFVFPDSREIARAGWADFIQPSLGPLQPNLDDFMDTFEPLNELISSKLPSVPEEQPNENIYKPLGTWECPDVVSLALNTPLPGLPVQSNPVTYRNKITPDFSDELIIGISNDNFVLPNAPNVKIANSTKQNKSQNEDLDYVVYGTMNKNIGASQIGKNIGSGFNKTSNQDYDLNLQSFVIGDSDNRGQQPQQQSLDTADSVRLQQQKDIEPSTSTITSQSILTPHKQDGSQSSNNSLTSITGGVIPKTKTAQGRQRSRSSTREQQRQHQRPPLLSAVSDPAIISTASRCSSVLLTQLLTGGTGTSTNIGCLTENANTGNVRVKREDAGLQTAVVFSGTVTAVASSSIGSSGDQVFSPVSVSNSPLGLTDQSSQHSHTAESPGGSGPPSPLRDTRRVGHIHAEQKRRYNIKNGFDMIHSLIPHLNQNPNTKLSKAAMLQKGADYIRQLRSERSQLNEEMDSLRQQIECLNTSISNCQSMLPATGAPVSRCRDNKVQEMFDEYVRNRTLENWKFWIFSLMIKPLSTSYNNFVSSSSLDELYRSTLHWVEQHCTLVHLRPIVLDSLRYLCTKTDILAEPDKLPEEARQAVATPTRSPSTLAPYSSL